MGSRWPFLFVARDLVAFIEMKRISRTVAAVVGEAKMEYRTDLDRKYTAEANGGMIKLVKTIKVKRLFVRAGVTCKALSLMAGGCLGRILKSDDGKVNLLVTTVSLLRTWTRRADVWINFQSE